MVPWLVLTKRHSRHLYLLSPRSRLKDDGAVEKRTSPGLVERSLLTTADRVGGICTGYAGRHPPCHSFLPATPDYEQDHLAHVRSVLSYSELPPLRLDLRSTTATSSALLHTAWTLTAGPIESAAAGVTSAATQ